MRTITYLVVFVILQLILFCGPARASEKGRIETYITKHYGPHKARAMRYVPMIREESKRQNVDPLLVVIIVHLESSSKHGAVSKVGACGLMQIKPCRSRPPRLNVRRGIKVLKREVKRCGSLLNGLNAYQSGKCAPVLKRVRFRLWTYRKARERK